MSEFRKYRLVTKLVDKYKVSWQPQRFLQYTVGPPPGGRDHQQDEAELVAARWWPLLMEVRAANPHLASSLLAFLACLASPPPRSTEIVTQSIPLNLDPKHERGAQDPPRGQVGRARPSSTQLSDLMPPLNDGHSRTDETDPTDQTDHQRPAYSLKPFTNSYEWCAGNLPRASQELFIIEDFFDLVLGASGRVLAWEHAGEGGPTLLVDETLSPHLLESIQPLIAIICSVRTIELFIESRDHAAGRVSEAFVAALQQYLSGFRDTVAQLERKFASGSIRLQALKMHVTLFERRLGLLSVFVRELWQSRASGGALLQRLEGLADRFAGDRDCRSFIEGLLAQSALPFAAMLKNWLETGQLDDPYHEFMVHSKQAGEGAKYECPFSEFTATEENVPLVLRARTRKLVQLGAYFVILCMEGDHGHPRLSVPDLPDLVFVNQRRIFQVIDSSFDKLGSLIMTRMMQGRHLVDRLEVCRGFYFLERLDLFGSFLDMCGAELSKPASSAIWEKIVACWDSSVEACTSEIEGCTIRIVQESLGLTQQLQRIIGSDASLDVRPAEGETYLPQCIEMVCLEASFDFPYSILLNKENLSKYNILFRFLLRLAFLQSGMAQMKPRRSGKPFCLLRRQMLVFLEGLHQYLVNDVIQARWRLLSEGVGGCKGLEEILSLHVEFLDSCLRQSMLTNGRLLKILNVLLCHCSRTIELGRLDPEDPGTVDRIASATTGFGRDMLSFMEALQYFSSRDYDYHLGALFSRMDSNSTYCRTLSTGPS